MLKNEDGRSELPFIAAEFIRQKHPGFKPKVIIVMGTGQVSKQCILSRNFTYYFL